MLDVNDETPTFHPATYNVSVSEDVPRDFRVVWLNCTDNDVGLNAELSYFITGPALPPPPPAWAASRERGRGLSQPSGLCCCWGLPEDMPLTSPQGFAPGSLWAGSLGAS